MVVVPADKGETMPPGGPVVMVATAVLLLLHVPPATASPKVNVAAPAHTLNVPVIVPADGREFTVTVCVAVTVPQDPLTV